MNRLFAFAALVAGALAGSADGGAYTLPNYGSTTAQVSSFVAAPPMPSSVMANPMMSSMMSSSMHMSMSSSMMSSMMSSMSSSMSMSMSSSMMSSMMSSATWQAWTSSKPTFATPTAAVTSSMSMSVMPSLITITSVAMPTATGWPAAPMATHTVMVGGSSLAYMPTSLSGVKDKDTIIFLFLQKNHTLTQSSFALPCNKTDNAFVSGFMPSDGTMIPFILAEFSDSMKTGAPLWFYCGQADHCEQGMRFSINPGSKDAAWRAINAISSITTASSMMTMSSSMPMASASVVPGTGTMNNGQCMCDCLCGVNAFPPGAGMGWMGGMPGMIPASSGPTMAPSAMASSALSTAMGQSYAAPMPSSSAAYGGTHYI